MIFRKKIKHLMGHNYYLRPPLQSDSDNWIKLREISREHLEQYEPEWEDNHLTHAGFKGYLSRIKNLQLERRGEGYLIFDIFSNRLLGSITLSNMRFGSVKSAWVGYWTGVSYVKQGVMCEALMILLNHAFDDYKLNRIEAATLPENVASQKLLEKNWLPI